MKEYIVHYHFYQPAPHRDNPVIQAPTEIAERYSRYGFKKLTLNFRRKGKQSLPVGHPAQLATPEALNQSWSIDFMHDALVCGRRF